MPGLFRAGEGAVLAQLKAVTEASTFIAARKAVAPRGIVAGHPRRRYPGRSLAAGSAPQANAIDEHAGADESGDLIFGSEWIAAALCFRGHFRIDLFQ